MWLLCLPFQVIIQTLLIGGFLTAIVVTCNHQTEEIIKTEADYCFVSDQFYATRGVRCDDPVTEYLFGGMQYQLEHHLFPTMPRYFFPSLRKQIKKFAEDNHLPFKVSGVVEIVTLNYEVMRMYSAQNEKTAILASSLAEAKKFK